MISFEKMINEIEEGTLYRGENMPTDIAIGWEDAYNGKYLCLYKRETYGWKSTKHRFEVGKQELDQKYEIVYQ